MKYLLHIAFCMLSIQMIAQESKDSTSLFKKRVLEATELDILTSFYAQDGQNAAVTGGIGTEQLTDLATDINVAIPLKADDVLTISATVSAYSSASSSNLNPWSGASSSGDDDDDDDDDNNNGNTGSPWVASSGASKQDVWVNMNIGYSHSSEDRNNILSGHISVATEYDYSSIGGGIGHTKLFNKKNSEISANASIFLDAWKPQYPTEIKTYVDNNGNLNAGFFDGTDILDQNGNGINKFDPNAWKPINTNLIEDKSRNTYALSLGFSQILSKSTQISIFTDFTYQEGWLANPMQRVYFADKSNFYIGNAQSITNYTNPTNTDVFQLADDIERLPSTRLKIPIGMRLNQYINQNLVLRTYYRYYFDDWGLLSHTLNAELAIKLNSSFTLYPNYRYYTQTAADYFAPFDMLLSTSQYYTSDFDLSKFNANQYGIALKYTDVFTNSHVWKFGLKGLTFDYNYYKRSTGLYANILTFGASFILE